MNTNRWYRYKFDKNTNSSDNNSISICETTSCTLLTITNKNKKFNRRKIVII